MLLGLFLKCEQGESEMLISDNPIVLSRSRCWQRLAGVNGDERSTLVLNQNQSTLDSSLDLF